MRSKGSYLQNEGILSVEQAWEGRVLTVSHLLQVTAVVAGVGRDVSNDALL